MSIKFQPIRDYQSNEVFDTIKNGLFPFVEKVFGWDDSFQKERIRKEYKNEWFQWVIFNGTKVALLCSKPYKQAIHIHLLIVFPDFQSKGIGRKIMEHIQDKARTESRDITLSSFKCNNKAISFYQKLGYEIIEEENDFLSFQLKAIAT